MSTIEIRQATIEDSVLILRFITELATYENATKEVLATEIDIKRSLFCSESTTSAIICNINHDPVARLWPFYRAKRPFRVCPVTLAKAHILTMAAL